MKIEYISASRLNKYIMCPFAYYLTYEKGLKDEAGPAARKGKVFHEVMENGISGKIDIFSKKEVDILLLELYNRIGNELSKEDQEECSGWVQKFILSDDFASVMQMDNKTVETPFRLTVDASMTISEGFSDDESLLKMHGFIDFMGDLSEKTLEVIDWKTGKGMKKFDELNTNDCQIRIYDLVASFLHPDKNVINTMYYLRKSPITLAFTDLQRINTIKYLYRYYNEIRNNNSPDRKKSWKCNRFCIGREKCDEYWKEKRSE